MFFPMFAGITVNIMRFSIPGLKPGYYTALVAIFMYYVIVANYISSRDSVAFWSSPLLRTLRLSSFASIIMQASMRLSYIML